MNNPIYPRLLQARLEEAREKKRVEIFMEDIDQGQKTLVFCATQDHALAVRDLVKQIKTRTNSAGSGATLIHAGNYLKDWPRRGTGASSSPN